MRGQVTARDVAAAAGVSRATVSYVFNRHARVRVTADTRARVLRAAAELGYTPNPLARGLRGSRTGVIGVVIGNIDVNYVGLDIVRAVCELAAREGYHVLMADAVGADAQEAAHVRVLVDRAVDGLIFNGPNAPAAVAQARARGLPVVMLERYPAVPGVPGVHTDNRAGSEAAVDHLWRLGHRSLAYIGLSDLHPHDGERYRAAIDAARERGMTVHPEWVYRRDDQDAAATYRFARRLVGAKGRPTAIYTGGNLFAIEVLRAAHDSGLRVPADLSVVSFDAQYAAYTYPRLTTVSAPSAALAEAALRILVDQLEGQGDGAEPRAGQPAETAVPPVLVQRESTGRAP